MNNQKRLRNLQYPSKGVGVSMAKLFATVVARVKSLTSLRWWPISERKIGCMSPPHKTRADAMLDLNIGTPISFVDKRAS